MKIAIIPARGGSKRIKDKSIVDFCGRPMISYALEAAQQSGLFDVIHVSTDSERVAAVAAELGFAPDFLRDASFADDHTPLMPVLRWVLQQFAKQGRAASDVCLLMPCAPLVEAGDLRAAHDAFVRAGRKTMVLAVVPFPYPVERALAMDAEGVLRPKFPESWHKRSQDLDPAYHDAGLFSFSPAAHILDPELVVTDRLLPYALPRYKAADIDEPEDLEYAEILYRGLQAMREATAPATHPRARK
jgi:N-acylneuraminate cytidylyltransferase